MAGDDVKHRLRDLQCLPGRPLGQPDSRADRGRQYGSRRRFHTELVVTAQVACGC